MAFLFSYYDYNPGFYTAQTIESLYDYRLYAGGYAARQVLMDTVRVTPVYYRRRVLCNNYRYYAGCSYDDWDTVRGTRKYYQRRKKLAWQALVDALEPKAPAAEAQTEAVVVDAIETTKVAPESAGTVVEIEFGERSELAEQGDDEMAAAEMHGGRVDGMPDGELASDDTAYGSDLEWEIVTKEMETPRQESEGQVTRSADASADVADTVKIMSWWRR